jgi:alanyl-tRNA synthetase
MGFRMSEQTALSAGACFPPVLSGEVAFKLHDTYGFPIDLTIEMAREQGVEVDTKRFYELMQEQKDRSRADAMAKRMGKK